MKVVTKSFLCGVSCFPGGKNCNNYCNHIRGKEMPDSPAAYEQLVMEEIDMWEDIINILAEYVPGEKSVFEILQSKYKVKQND
jgi:hypothetical protein